MHQTTTCDVNGVIRSYCAVLLSSTEHYELLTHCFGFTAHNFTVLNHFHCSQSVIFHPKAVIKRLNVSCPAPNGNLLFANVLR